MPIKSVKIKISKNKKMLFFLMSQGSFSPKIRFLDQKVCSVARTKTDTKVNTEDTLSGFQDFILQPIIKDRSTIWGANFTQKVFEYNMLHFVKDMSQIILYFYFIYRFLTKATILASPKCGFSISLAMISSRWF